MTTTPGTSPTSPAPTETLIVGQDGAVLLTVQGALVLPIGTRIQVDADADDATVVGLRFVRTDPGAPQLLLEVDGGGSSFIAAVREADAEAQVVEAAEDITSAPESGLAESAPPPVD